MAQNGNPRLPLDRCRRLLPQERRSLADGELERLRDQLYELARAAVRAYASDRRARLSRLTPRMIDGDLADVEERAAILEFDGRLSRVEAEKIAFHSPIRTPQ